MRSDLFATDGGLYFGYATSQLEGPPQRASSDHLLRVVTDRHVLTYGPTASGKSRRLILPNMLLLTGWSILCVDVKGEIAAQTFRHRQVAGNDTYLFNPYSTLGMPSHGYNPVSALNPAADDFIDKAQAQAEAVIALEGKEPHWAASAQDALCALIIYSRLTDPNGGSYGHVRSLLCKPSLEFAKIVEDMNEVAIIHDCEELAVKAARFMDITPENRELLSILSTAMTQTRWLDSRPMKRDLAKGKFDFACMRERPTTVYAVLPANRLVSQSKWLRLVITDFLLGMLSDPRPSKVPVLLMIDEAAQLGDLPLLRDSIALLRGYGCKVWMVFQDLPQHKAVAGQERFESVAANCGVLHSFAPQDMSTGRFLSDRGGQTTGDLLGYSAPLGAIDGKPADGKISFNRAPMPTMLPQEFMNMGEGYAVLFSHKTKGIVQAYLPDPSEVASFDRMLQESNMKVAGV